jgi:hypothetical protein
VALSIIVFLAGAAFGTLVLFIISIHRASHARLSEAHGERGSISRSVLTATRPGPGECSK